MEPKRVSIVDRLYEEQIRALSLRDQLHLAQRIIADAASIAEPKRQSRSLLELEGLGADLWGSVDAQDYVNRIRREWDDRP